MRKTLTASITRPADTTQYAAGDVVGTDTSHIITFSNAKDMGAQDVNRGLVVEAQVISTAAPATLPSLELWLFSAAPAVQADNTAFAVTDAEMLAGFLGVIPLAYTHVGLASGNHAQRSDPCAVQFEVAATKSDIYGCLVVRNTYTPISGEQFKVILSVLD